MRLGLHGNAGMTLRWNPEHNLAGIWALRCNSLFLAVCQIVFNSLGKSRLKLYNACPMKARNRADSSDRSHKYLVFVIISCQGVISLVPHCFQYVPFRLSRASHMFSDGATPLPKNLLRKKSGKRTLTMSMAP